MAAAYFFNLLVLAALVVAAYDILAQALADGNKVLLYIILGCYAVNVPPFLNQNDIVDHNWVGFDFLQNCKGPSVQKEHCSLEADTNRKKGSSSSNLTERSVLERNL